MNTKMAWAGNSISSCSGSFWSELRLSLQLLVEQKKEHLFVHVLMEHFNQNLLGNPHFLIDIYKIHLKYRQICKTENMKMNIHQKSEVFDTQKVLIR